MTTKLTLRPAARARPKQLLRKGNSNLSRDKNVWVFTLPALYAVLPDGTTVVTCPQAGTCALVCYARFGTYTWSNVAPAHVANLLFVVEDLPGWEAAMRKELAAEKFKGAYVRIHDAGDFFDVLWGWPACGAMLRGSSRGHRLRRFCGGVALWLDVDLRLRAGELMRAFAVKMPSGSRYWTVLDERWEPVPVADRFLRELRFGRDRAESTTEAYARSVALFLRWCGQTGRDWTTAVGEMGMFITWLTYAPGGEQPSRVVGGPGATPVRSARRINRVLVAVRGFVSFAVVDGEAPEWVLGALYELASRRDLPIEAQGEDGRLALRMRSRHRLSEPETNVDRASDEEIVALFAACRSARDRLIVLLLARTGLRRGAVAGLRREDMHFAPDNGVLGCDVAGAHVHVVRRENPNGAWAKSRRPYAVPADFMVVQAYDQYVLERHERGAGAASDFVLVNLFRAPIGGPMTPDAIGDLIERLAVRAGLRRRITPHMLRHGFGSNLADAGASLDEIQTLLGHAHAGSAKPYLHPDIVRLRAAVERVGTPRAIAERVAR